MPILSLPKELRLEIYTHAADFNLASFLPYLGLYTSCHQIKREMDVEILKILTLRLRKISCNIQPDLGIKCEILTTSMRAMRDLRLVLSKKICGLGYNTHSLPAPRCLDAVFALPLHSLTLTFDYTDSARTRLENINWMYVHLLTGSLLGEKGTLKARRLIIDIGRLDREIELETWITLAEQSNWTRDASTWRRHDWIVDWKGAWIIVPDWAFEHDCAKVVFERTGSAKKRLGPKLSSVWLALAGPL